MSTNNGAGRLIRISYKKTVNGVTEEKEIIWAGYHGLVLVLVLVIIAGVMLVLSGAKIF